MTVEERSSAAVSDEGASRPDPWQAAFIILLVSGLVGAVLWVLFGSRLLAVRQIEVTGLDRLAETEVLAAVDVTPGTPLARVDTDAVAARVSELRLVDSVDVQRGWPATLRVAVTERVPVFALAAADGGYLLVDWEGVWVEKSERSRKATHCSTYPATSKATPRWPTARWCLPHSPTLWPRMWQPWWRPTGPVSPWSSPPGPQRCGETPNGQRTRPAPWKCSWRSIPLNRDATTT